MTTDEKTHVAPGTVLDGKYRVDKQIGAGGMGAVFLATHTTIGRKVAIKTLHAEYTTDEQVVARFHREAQLAGSIGHDNICEVTDVGKLEDGSPYLVMPLLIGQGLSDVMASGDGLSLKRVVDMSCQTLSALAAAHDNGIVHRDLKPDNIFITSMGDREDFVKLLDFGISKIIEQDEVTQLTMTGAVLGTPFYMAPEQAKGEKSLDRRVDIYAMGVILYEALTGTRPFVGDSYNEIMFKIIAEPFTPPSAINPSIPPSIEKVIFKAMDRDPDRRFATADDMRLALVAAAAGKTVDFDTRMSHAPTVASGSDAALTPMSAAYPQSPGTGTMVAAAGARKSGRIGIVIGIAGGVVAIIAVVLFFVMGGFSAPIQPPMPANQAPSVASPADSIPEIVDGSPAEEAQAPASPATEAPDGDRDDHVAAQTPVEETESGKKKKKKKKKKVSSGSTASSDKKVGTTEKKKKSDTVKGRFGTTFVGDYDD